MKIAIQMKNLFFVKYPIFAAGIFMLLVPTCILAQDKSTTEPDRQTIISAALEMMNEVPFCALITVDGNGQPHVRTMDPFAPDSNLVVWFGTNKLSRKVKEIENDGRVSLYYADPKGQGYVTIEGIAILVDEKNIKSEKWKNEWDKFYPDRENTYILIKILPRKLSIISYKHGLSGNPQNWAAHAIDFN
ncbi:pyridoxamine 5'-phosphate oxidase family protein [candidate division KSB1 bacterium]|nr:pyridoxamine 5'-phosphate oxidase family protein [candidate division KSB1 bacterium]